MTRSRKAALALGLVGAVLLGVCSVRPRPRGAGDGAVAARSPDPELPDDTASTEPSPSDDPAASLDGDGAHACAAARAEVAGLAIRTAETCGEAFERGLCPAPVAFPPGETPEAQTRAIEEEYAGCDLAPLVDCGEYPCVAVFSRRALEQHPGPCDALRDLVDLAPSGDDHAAELGEVWADWVPSSEVPTDPELRAQVVARTRNRMAEIVRRLEEMEATGGASLPSDCGRVDRALTGLRSTAACDVLRDYWGCPPEDAPITEEMQEQYEVFAEQVLDDLIRDCPLLSDDNTLLDCSGVPCTIVADVGSPDLGDGEAFCDAPQLSSFLFARSGAHPNLRIGVVFLRSSPRSYEAAVRERFAREQRQRIRDTLSAWEARQQ